MASKTVEYGRNWVLKITGGTVQIDNLTTNGYTQARDTRETTTKDSADDEETEVTIKRRTVPFGGLVTEASSSGNFAALQGLYTNGTVVTYKFGNTTAGTHYWSGSGRITKLDVEGQHDGNVTFTGEIRVTGSDTYGTN